MSVTDSVEKIFKKIDEDLDKFDIVKQASAATGVRVAYLALGVFSFVLVALFFGFGAGFMW